MGNSGSVHNISDVVEQYTQPPVQWNQGIPHRDPFAAHTQQIKVLPALNGCPRLRPTNNGVILHAGGTLTNRNVPPNTAGITKLLPPAMSRAEMGLIQMRARSQTQIDMRAHRQHDIMADDMRRSSLGGQSGNKRFGSEPDLRNLIDKQTMATPSQAPPIGGTAYNANAVKAKIVRGKKKKTAPAPPQVQREFVEQRHSLDSNRFGWPQQSLVDANQDMVTRKSRLYKTKVESQKNPVQRTTSVDQSDNGKPVEVRKQLLSRTAALPGHLDKYRNGNPLPEISNRLPPLRGGISSIPKAPVYRREKSFDLSLLMSREKDPNLRQRRPSVQRGGAPSINDAQPISAAKQLARKSLDAPSSRQSSSDFQRELLMATRKRNEEQKSTPSHGIKDGLKPRLPRTNLPPLIKKVPVKTSTTKENKPTVEKAKSCPKPDTKSSSNTTTVKSECAPTINTPLVSTQQSATAAEKSACAKTFYFGMDDPAMEVDESEAINKTQMDIIDKFAESLLKQKRHPVNQRGQSEDSESLQSSEPSEEYTLANNMVPLPPDDENVCGINVNIRPSLPRRQLEIPRFSPQAAWRTLIIAEETAQTLTTESAPKNPDTSAAMQTSTAEGIINEQRIQRIYRDPVQGFSDNKSGDSGISGDAVLPEMTDLTIANGNAGEVMLQLGEMRTKKLSAILTPWTPQQDLGEDSSSEGGDDRTPVTESFPAGTKGHVFSLSLPREAHLAGYSGKFAHEKQSFNSLQKFKKKVSGVLNGSASGNSDRDKTKSFDNDNNWFLSRSAPNSIDNSHVSHNLKFSSDNQDHSFNASEVHKICSNNSSPFGYLTNGKHVMYLPNHTVGETSTEHDEEQHDSGKYFKESYTKHTQENLQDTPLPEKPTHDSQQKECKSRSSRFTFQSTVRQIERKRIAEKLSKEAEHKEAQRRCELEAMKKVEAEFQRKRAREKASIRHQLRLFLLEENQCSSLPVDWHSDNQLRTDPDGVGSSPTYDSPTPPEYALNDNSFAMDGYHFSSSAQQMLDTTAADVNHNDLHSTEVSPHEHHMTRKEYLMFQNGSGKRHSNDFPAVWDNSAKPAMKFED